MPSMENAEGWEGWDWYRAISSVLKAVEETSGKELAISVAGRTPFPGTTSIDLTACACAGDPEDLLAEDDR